MQSHKSGVESYRIMYIGNGKYSFCILLSFPFSVLSLVYLFFRPSPLWDWDIHSRDKIFNFADDAIGDASKKDASTQLRALDSDGSPSLLIWDLLCQLRQLG